MFNSLRFFVFMIMVMATFSAKAAILFTDGFYSGNYSISNFQAWTGAGGTNNHSGLVVPDPLNSNNSVLSFTALTTGGELITQGVTAGGFLSFDYLGICGTGDCGGAVGYSNFHDFSGSNVVWLAGTHSPRPDVLLDTGMWEHITVPFGSNVHLVVQQFSGASGAPGQVFFDNFLITDIPPVPEPASPLMMMSGLLVLGFVAHYGRYKNALKQ